MNNEPRIIGVDDGIWTRIHLIFWSVFIKPEERILNLRERLCSEEAAGIFNWAIAGLKDYQKNRLVPSQQVLNASKSFRKNSDQIQRFMDERCELGDFQIGSSDLYAAYKRWADETKEFQLKDRQLKHYLETSGFQFKHTEHGNVGLGIKGARQRAHGRQQCQLRKFNAGKFIDQLMSDGKRRSERQIKSALVAAYAADYAGADFRKWLRLRDTPADQGLRLEEAGPLSGRKDPDGKPLRYTYWRVEQDPDKIAPGDPIDRLPTGEEALRLVERRRRRLKQRNGLDSAVRAGVAEG